MVDDNNYSSRYKSSWALVIGINKYQYSNPLAYACNDAKAVARSLIESFTFPDENVTVLLDNEATKSAILSSFLAHRDLNSHVDDRGIVFFAGHGHTVPGFRKDVGYLVPVDGNVNDLATLVRWDELTGNADLLPAKHILFIMDACYSGLIVQRHVPLGSKRFLKDMLRRRSRQALAAGKADETVADGGGPRNGHSMFTGHLLDALDVAAASADKVITANDVMAYVYDRVSRDEISLQTPHYGVIDGDGDFIFSELPSELYEIEQEKVVLVNAPVSLAKDQAADMEEEGSLQIFSMKVPARGIPVWSAGAKWKAGGNSHSTFVEMREQTWNKYLVRKSERNALRLPGDDPFKMRLDCLFIEGIDAASVDAIEIRLTERPTMKFAFYVKLGVNEAGSWLVWTNSNSSTVPANERNVPLPEPIDGNASSKYVLQFQEALKNTWGASGMAFQKILGLRFRGDFCLLGLRILAS